MNWIEGNARLERALAFASSAHAGQRRKFTGEPYIVHPIAVALLLRDHGHDDDLAAAGLLHDTIEDCGVTADELKAQFGAGVARLVVEVTKVSTKSQGNRAARAEIDRDHLAGISQAGMTLKLADIIDNTSSAAQRDPAFAAVYLAEKRALLTVLRGGDQRLWRRAAELCGFRTAV